MGAEELVLEKPGQSGDQVPHNDLTYTWESFIDTLIREWRVFNIISVLLLSFVLAFLRIPRAADDPSTRFSALLSLLCALVSLFYGCIYMVRFEGMRQTGKGAEWVSEAQRAKSSIFWNVWVLLAMPSIWLSWSILSYLTSILCFVRKATIKATDYSPPVVTAQDILGHRIAISAIFGLGVIYFILISTTYRWDIDVDVASTAPPEHQQEPPALCICQARSSTKALTFVQHVSTESTNYIRPSEGPPPFDEAQGSPTLAMNTAELGSSLPSESMLASEETLLSEGAEVIERNLPEETKEGHAQVPQIL